MSDENEPPNRGRVLAVLLLLAALVAGGLWLTRRLGEVGRLQDCVASGRTNCAPVAAAPR